MEIGKPHRIERAHGDRPGVVNEGVDGAQLLGHPAHDALHVLANRDVTRDGHYRPAVCFQLSLGAREGIGVARADGYAGSFTEEFSRDEETKSPRAPGYENGAAAELPFPAMPNQGAP
jgi:hypothetical protein